MCQAVPGAGETAVNKSRNSYCGLGGDGGETIQRVKSQYPGSTDHSSALDTSNYHFTCLHVLGFPSTYSVNMEPVV